MAVAGTAGRSSPWPEVRVCVVGGLGVSGFAAADALIQIGADVVVLDDEATAVAKERATLLEILGVDVRMGPGSTDRLPDRLDLVVTAPGLPPTTPMLVAAGAAGLPVWGEVELAWRMRDPERDTPWLCITGTNGKTTTVQMLESILRADGLRAVGGGKRRDFRCARS